MKIYEPRNLKSFNTFGLDVNARMFLEIEDIRELPLVNERFSLYNLYFYTLGGGSNTLFTEDYNGIILHITEKNVTISNQEEDYVYVKASSGVVWDNLVKYIVEEGLWGAENLSYIPGSVGASAVQNIGAYSCEAKDIIHIVEYYDVIDMKFKSLNNDECLFGYRDSIFKNELKKRAIITSVTYRLQKTPSPKLNYNHLKQMVEAKGEITVGNIREAVIEIRKEKLPDPSVRGNCGSFFKNPVVDQKTLLEIKRHHPDIQYFDTPDNMAKLSAAWMIDKAGWKGFCYGGAGVHDKQPLVLVNNGQAMAKDITTLASMIEKDIKDKFSVDISPEVIIL